MEPCESASEVRGRAGRPQAAPPQAQIILRRWSWFDRFSKREWAERWDEILPDRELGLAVVVPIAVIFTWYL